MWQVQRDQRYMCHCYSQSTALQRGETWSLHISISDWIHPFLSGDLTQNVNDLMHSRQPGIHFLNEYTQHTYSRYKLPTCTSFGRLSMCNDSSTSEQAQDPCAHLEDAAEWVEFFEHLTRTPSWMSFGRQQNINKDVESTSFGRVVALCGKYNKKTQTLQIS